MEYLLIIGGILFALIIGAALVLPKAKQSTQEDFGTFTKQPLLNKAETSLAKILDEISPQIHGSGTRILTQVSYGEFIKGGDRAAHARINQKRADFLIVDKAFDVICVLEYQGSGHYGKSTRAKEGAEHRDRVKRHACQSAGIAFIEVPKSFSKESIKTLLSQPR